ncbi:MAG: alanyl-tRNA editing protein, partial [Arenicellales bacterium]|nr:alanyl-tRNA editing protein [Arenicellales bacterium]
LCALIDAPVSGGSIADGRGRLDFDLPETLDKEVLTGQLNMLIKEDHLMHLRWISDSELTAQPDLVRTMSVRPPSGTGRVRLVEFEGVDLQPCGGTHVSRSGEIGEVVVTRIEKKGRQNRRVIVQFAPV